MATRLSDGRSLSVCSRRPSKTSVERRFFLTPTGHFDHVVAAFAAVLERRVPCTSPRRPRVPGPARPSANPNVPVSPAACSGASFRFGPITATESLTVPAPLRAAGSRRQGHSPFALRHLATRNGSYDGVTTTGAPGSPATPDADRGGNSTSPCPAFPASNSRRQQKIYTRNIAQMHQSAARRSSPSDVCCTGPSGLHRADGQNAARRPDRPIRRPDDVSALGRVSRNEGGCSAPCGHLLLFCGVVASKAPGAGAAALVPTMKHGELVRRAVATILEPPCLIISRRRVLTADGAARLIRESRSTSRRTPAWLRPPSNCAMGAGGGGGTPEVVPAKLLRHECCHRPVRSRVSGFVFFRGRPARWPAPAVRTCFRSDDALTNSLSYRRGLTRKLPAASQATGVRARASPDGFSAETSRCGLGRAEPPIGAPR